MNTDARIELTDTPLSAIAKLCDGNPGALTVCCELFKQGAEIDPNAFGGGLSALLSLDSYGIYGPDIWMLFKDVCGQSIPHTIGMLRAVQLGILPESTLKHAIQNRGNGLDVAATFKAVCERLPDFANANALTAEFVG